MLGKVVTNACHLNYTGVARPLTFDDIHADINILAAEDHPPEKIVLWQQQWDWLVKCLPPSAREADVPVPTFCGEFSRNLAEQPSTIWGVRVEIKAFTL
jgi:hypothetical protein